MSGFESYEIGERNGHDDKTESLNTPSIDLKSFEQRKHTNYSKLELLITADQFSTMCDNLNSQATAEPVEAVPEDELQKAEISRMEILRAEASVLDTPPTSSTHPPDTASSPKPKPRPKLILPKSDPIQNQLSSQPVPQSQLIYSYVLKVRFGCIHFRLIKN